MVCVPVIVLDNPVLSLIMSASNKDGLTNERERENSRDFTHFTSNEFLKFQ